MRVFDEVERVLDAREIGLRGEREEVPTAGLYALEQHVQTVAVDSEVGHRQRGVVDLGAFRRRELADAVDGVVVIDGEEVAAARREGITLADVLERAAGVQGEDRRVLADGVEETQDRLPGPFDQRCRRHRTEARRMGVAEHAGLEQRLMGANLRIGV
jgi:hypothetical protein